MGSPTLHPRTHFGLGDIPQSNLKQTIMNLVKVENGGENSMSLVDFMKAAELTELRFLKSKDPAKTVQWVRSEEHTSELQSH